MCTIARYFFPSNQWDRVHSTFRPANRPKNNLENSVKSFLIFMQKLREINKSSAKNLLCGKLVSRNFFLMRESFFWL